MKLLITKSMLKILGKSLLLTLLAGIIVGAIGYVNEWDSSARYPTSP
ncbi:MAG: hypothetical protein HY867_19160 [Chloroflexi bacterium]|nr:hypothetical protein [Chloroflexota bacterium]